MDHKNCELEDELKHIFRSSNIGLAISTIRHFHQISRDELIREVKKLSPNVTISNPTLYGYEKTHREPPLELVTTIADIFDIPLDSLFSFAQTLHSIDENSTLHDKIMATENNIERYFNLLKRKNMLEDDENKWVSDKGEWILDLNNNLTLTQVNEVKIHRYADFRRAGFYVEGKDNKLEIKHEG